MRKITFFGIGVLLATLLAAGCYRPFSPEIVRREIVRQAGVEPQSSFEFKLGGATMKLAKAVVSKAAGEPIRFGGLTRVDLAVFEVPQGKGVDFAKLRLWGWDRLIQTRKEGRSFLVLVRTDGKNLADLVLVAQGDDQVLYGRLKGKLDPGLPAALQRALESTGLKGLKEHLLSAGRGGEAPPSGR